MDVGELPDEPAALWALAHRVNIACGGHAGDRDSIADACRRARGHRARVGAHPSYPDREHFGRVALDLSPEELHATVLAQCAFLAVVARSEGVPVSHVKPHGALYHRADRDPVVARAFLDAARGVFPKVALLGPPGGELQRAARRARLPFLREGFADRGYRPDGSLVPRGEPGDLLTDPAVVASQARALLASGRYDTLCLHGDTPGALTLALAVRRVLDGG